MNVIFVQLQVMNVIFVQLQVMNVIFVVLLGCKSVDRNTFFICSAITLYTKCTLVNAYYTLKDYI